MNIYIMCIHIHRRVCICMSASLPLSLCIYATCMDRYNDQKGMNFPLLLQPVRKFPKIRDPSTDPKE